MKYYQQQQPSQVTQRRLLISAWKNRSPCDPARHAAVRLAGGGHFGGSGLRKLWEYSGEVFITFWHSLCQFVIENYSTALTGFMWMLLPTCVTVALWACCRQWGVTCVTVAGIEVLPVWLLQAARCYLPVWLLHCGHVAGNGVLPTCVTVAGNGVLSTCDCCIVGMLQEAMLAMGGDGRVVLPQQAHKGWVVWLIWYSSPPDTDCLIDLIQYTPWHWLS